MSKLAQKRARGSDVGAPEREPPGMSSGASSSGESSDSDASPSGSKASAVQVDFEFHDPREADFLGLKALLHTYLDGQEFSCSELVDAVIHQARPAPRHGAPLRLQERL